jgi:hypothetical protein
VGIGIKKVIFTRAIITLAAVVSINFPHVKISCFMHLLDK